MRPANQEELDQAERRRQEALERQQNQIRREHVSMDTPIDILEDYERNKK